jgi:5'-deoxynucleotidase YfbR-like HD superfamily hydrolase/DNA-binding transcriptional regulator YhcF (GntR family)
MQPIDPADPRHPYVKIAAAIQAAILSGELQPGEQLPSGEELAAFHGVTRGVIVAAIRQLREAGFVDSQQGAPARVADRQAQPVPGGEQHPLAGTAGFLFEMGHLKHVSRAGWTLIGIPAPETVAEHSHRVTVAGIVLAAMEGADTGRTAALCALHDAHETRIGDVPSVGRAYVTTAAPEAISAHQTAGLPHDAAKALQELTQEYEAGLTIEARLARDADKIETLLQAMEYAAAGHDTAQWVKTSTDALRTGAAQELARAIQASGPYDWLAPFQASYHELRASAQKRSRESGN